MPINEGLANLSHYAFVVTVVAYALAVLAFACDFAFGRHALGPLQSARSQRHGPRRGGLGAREPPTPGTPRGPAQAHPASGTPGPGDRGRDAGGMGRWVQVAIGLTALGLAAHILGVVSRGLAVHRVPWGDMYEFVTTVTCVAVIFFFVLMFRYRAWRLGLFVIGPVVILLGLAETVIYTPAGQLASGAAVLLARHPRDLDHARDRRVRGGGPVRGRLPARRPARQAGPPRACPPGPTRSSASCRPPKVIDQLAYRTVVFGFPLWTFGIIAGAIWADRGLGPVLGLGSHRNLGLHHLGGVRGLPARPRHRGLAGTQVRLHPADRLRVPALQHHRGQHPRQAGCTPSLSCCAASADWSGAAAPQASPPGSSPRMSRSSALMNSGSSSGPVGGLGPAPSGWLSATQAVRLQPSLPARRVAPDRRLRALPVPGRVPGAGKRTARQPPDPHAADQQPRDEQGGQYSQQHHGRSLTSVVPACR